MIAVPSILMVAPKGMEKEPIDLLTPILSVTVLMETGMVALELAVPNANVIAVRILDKNVRGLSFASVVNNTG